MNILTLRKSISFTMILLTTGSVMQAHAIVAPPRSLQNGCLSIPITHDAVTTNELDKRIQKQLEKPYPSTKSDIIFQNIINTANKLNQSYDSQVLRALYEENKDRRRHTEQEDDNTVFVSFPTVHLNVLGDEDLDDAFSAYRVDVDLSFLQNVLGLGNVIMIDKWDFECLGYAEDRMIAYLQERIRMPIEDKDFVLLYLAAGEEAMAKVFLEIKPILRTALGEV
jgi:hypothetical protein